MRTLDLIKFTLSAIIAHRLRSVLTILGIMVGIGSVVLLTSIGEGVRMFVLAEFTQFGTNLVAVVPGKTTTLGLSGATISTVRPLSLDDANALQRLADVIAVVPVVQGNASVEFGASKRRSLVLGVGPRVPDVWKMPVSSGVFLPEDSFTSARAYAVLGATLREELFGNANPLGKRIRVGEDRYRVIGVMAPKGQMLGFDLDDTIYLPIDKTLAMFNREGLMEIDVLYEAGASSARIEQNIRRLMIARHGHEDFSVITQDKMLEVLDTILNVLTLGVAAIGSISLIVGAVGIVTIMTIAVTERTGEIGLLRALGAKRIHILNLFLGEAVVLSGIGGIGGISVTVLVIYLVKLFLPAFPLEVAWLYISLALALATVIGVIAGITPAMRAAGMHPLEALRAE
ncbi:MAG: peptide ABC transporter permease [Gammaproteobacteria bacterium RIFCSPLOWO2_02_FULL_52_10]|nr:MAG: peptide ABC transporter permease [Gammaproteobacteria bacterium RIFCSPLOWO2_02_FULL_52_10]OGT82172.1 MAG: peptide ABC transporter permease [Gammaproteobacteria bacterium RIFCSPLOWO2_12_FULL_52_10]